MLASIFESGAVYYPTILGIPIIVGALLGWKRRDRRALWILAAAIFAFILFDFAFDETRFEDIPFFIVLGVFMFLVGLLARFVAAGAPEPGLARAPAPEYSGPTRPGLVRRLARAIGARPAESRRRG